MYICSYFISLKTPGLRIKRPTPVGRRKRFRVKSRAETFFKQFRMVAAQENLCGHRSNLKSGKKTKWGRIVKLKWKMKSVVSGCPEMAIVLSVATYCSTPSRGLFSLRRLRISRFIGPSQHQ